MDIKQPERFDAKIEKTFLGTPKWFDSYSPYGYVIGDALSACIKEVRRNNFRDATFWAHQVAISGEDAEKFLWDTLFIHSIEDIGLANSEMVKTVEVCRNRYFNLPSQHEARFMTIFFIIRLMCLSKKSRSINNGYSMMTQKLRDIKEIIPKIPDFAYDLHTRKGKEMGRGHEHYLNEASILINEDKSCIDEDALKWINQ